MRCSTSIVGSLPISVEDSMLLYLKGLLNPSGLFLREKISKSFRYNGDNTKGIANTIPNFGAQAFEV